VTANKPKMVNGVIGMRQVRQLSYQLRLPKAGPEREVHKNGFRLTTVKYDRYPVCTWFRHLVQGRRRR